MMDAEVRPKALVSEILASSTRAEIQKNEEIREAMNVEETAAPETNSGN
jgi:hypothetical protein